MKTKNLEQIVEFSCAPKDVYEALMDSKKHAQFTESKTKIGSKIGEKISAYDGWIEGFNLELEKDKLIVQAWRGADWAKAHYSIATFALSKTAKGTKLEFSQIGVPEDTFAEISQGWHEHYWNKMKEMLEK
ncbi:MAG: SRPBCC domain-containing protein [Candidatus Diapherotrites archaeon]|nr:SRPBCC domain-containing protein [Candidatus Diapherotrites archaeon]